ncbi:MAG TPA: hypothetical protein GXZ74_01400 [Tissierellia bacterium]|nr:hypothetical protein [Tissierellia bacterium]
MKSNVDNYLEQNPRWKEIIIALRELLKPLDLAETISGGDISYTYQGRDVATIESLSRHVSLVFSKGVLLEDTDSVLEEPENGSIINRQLSFTTTEAVADRAEVIADFFDQAIELEKDGVKSVTEPDD